MYNSIKKFSKYILGYTLYLLSFLTPKKNNIWLFGNMHGYYENSKYLFLLMLKNTDVNCYWLSKDRKLVTILKQKGIPAEYTFSVKGIFLSLQAKVYIYNYSIDDINVWTSARTIKVNLWHGVGIKKLQNQITVGNSINNFKVGFCKKIQYPQNHIKPDLFLSTSPLMNTHFAKSFNIPISKIIEASYPRCELLSNSKNEILEFIISNEPYPELYKFMKEIKEYSASYLYMPTWRDSGKSNLDALNLSELNSFLKLKNEIFYIKIHPNEILYNPIEMKSHSNIKILDRKIDIYLFIPFIDTLITDYSSIYYDFILMKGKRVILYPYDYNEYIVSERDLAFDYEQYTIGNRAYNQLELMKIMDDTTPHDNNLEISKIRDIFWSKKNDSTLIISSIKKLYNEV